MGLAGSKTAGLFQNPLQKAACCFPVTMACWVFCPASPSVQNNADYFMSLVTNTPSNGKAAYSAHAVGTGTPSQWAFGINIGVGNVGTYDYSTSSHFGAGWHHWCATFSDQGTAGTFSAGGCNEYIDGQLDSPGFPPGGPIAGFVNRPDLSQVQLLPGSLSGNLVTAFASIWNSILTTAQIATLVKGADPRSVSPATLASFCKLVGNQNDMNNTVGVPDLCQRQPYVYQGTGLLVPSPGPRIYIQT